MNMNSIHSPSNSYGNNNPHSPSNNLRSPSNNTNNMNYPRSQSRNASYTSSPSHPPVSGNSSHNRNASRSSNTSASSNFLAEQYERDRKLIIDSCFTKPNKNGQPNNYITHVRIIEDSKFPSSRPVPNYSKLENKKKRILVLSSSSINQQDITLHKGRENNNNTFQIGRSWNLSELKMVEKDLKVDQGFILLLTKKYYWETNSSKERKVFVKSLINIFMQAFNGRVPELVNWDLSLFHLDETSYNRAVIKHSTSSNTNTAQISTSAPLISSTSNTTNETGYPSLTVDTSTDKNSQKEHHHHLLHTPLHAKALHKKKANNSAKVTTPMISSPISGSFKKISGQSSSNFGAAGTMPAAGAALVAGVTSNTKNSNTNSAPLQKISDSNSLTTEISNGMNTSIAPSVSADITSAPPVLQIPERSRARMKAKNVESKKQNSSHTSRSHKSNDHSDPKYTETDLHNNSMISSSNRISNQQKTDDQNGNIIYSSPSLNETKKQSPYDSIDTSNIIDDSLNTSNLDNQFGMRLEHNNNDIYSPVPKYGKNTTHAKVSKPEISVSTNSIESPSSRSSSDKGPYTAGITLNNKSFSDNQFPSVETTQRRRVSLDNSSSPLKNSFNIRDTNNMDSTSNDNKFQIPTNSSTNSNNTRALNSTRYGTHSKKEVQPIPREERLSPVQTHTRQESNSSMHKRDSENLLSDLNNLLGADSTLDPPNFTNHLNKTISGDIENETIATSKTGMSIPESRMETPLSMEPTPVSHLPKESIRNDVTNLDSINDSQLKNMNKSYNDVDVFGDETTEDLSFEKGDEIRYSAQFNEQMVHEYHQVTTIEEEEDNSLPSHLMGLNIKNELVGLNNAEQQNKAKVSLLDDNLIDDDTLLEVLTDVNWNPYDNVDTLEHHLAIKLQDYQHNLNSNLLKLESMGPSLDKYQYQLEQECEKISPTFSLFLMEMNNVSQDIEFIENQDNGLQIESANRKLLWKILSELLNTVSLDENALNELLTSPITERNLHRIELQLQSLYNALKAIKGDENEKTKDYDLGEMNALKYRRKTYEKVTKVFLKKVVNDLDAKFDSSLNSAKSDAQLTSILSRLLIFSSLTCFCKDISPETFSELIDKWNSKIEKIYGPLCESFISNLDVNNFKSQTTANDRFNSRGLLMQPNEDLFIEKLYNVKKLKTQQIDSNGENKIMLHNNELTKIMENLGSIENICIVYQNFIDSFFHISSDLDFSDFMNIYAKPESRVRSLDTVSSMRSDRESAAIELQFVSKIFQPIMNRITQPLNSTIQQVPLINPSLIMFLQQRDEFFESTNQEFLLNSINRLEKHLRHQWSNFIEEQSLNLERTGLVFSTRTILPSLLGFPVFVKNVFANLKFTENALEISNVENFTLNELLRTTLQRLALASTTTVSKGINESVKQTADSNIKDKCTTSLINSVWLGESLTLVNQDDIFSKAVIDMKKIFDDQKEVYATLLLRETMPKLISFVTGASNVLENLSSSGNHAASRMAVYSKQNLNIILAGYTTQEMIHIISSLHSTMLADFENEKHDKIKELLFTKLWSCIQGLTVSLYLKLYTLIEKHYTGTRVNFSKNDIISAFESFKN
ncbi:hypothetical protein TBLA_0A01080 [Henningerozyma blattae CBS 6284]|uniref:Exocyst complex component Sec3 PIP2-binding N-terminal domain-containing protein n=1 Tax=Henningerozyma blattae (strain ATCC 34711 / CBS 6284 / DSM 70876 / NBRC 10599 / NRRL Y-10934 / UCD 77-7) TaxID=1071380 RepID=I2GUV6_HENB6|nr:hypothetical protein TBLA_0A01080 [Tetrapisispora blattae CBS 6284]CCH57908.1 hypothetical protein TBLA_0A01080 [Tetrapisispora blattae CBS 6284]